jgi:hypothetical protein
VATVPAAEARRLPVRKQFGAFLPAHSDSGHSDEMADQIDPEINYLS